MHLTRALSTIRNLAVASWIGLAGVATGKPPGPQDVRPDPRLVVPWCSTAPTIDGVLQADEWRFAAALSLFEAFPGTGVPQILRQEQPIFYVFRDDENLYIAMDCVESNTNTVVAACMQNDNMRIIGDDCVEMMIAPGAGEQVHSPSLPVYYFAMNAIGTVWDAKFFPKFAECHNSWHSGVETQSTVNGTRWVCEIRLPFAAIRKEAPRDGETWRMNLDRTYSGYSWSAWNANGGLNDARVGGDVSFVRKAPAVRILSAHPLTTGVLGINVEVANATDTAQTVALSLSATSGVDNAKRDTTLTPVKETVTVPPGQVIETMLSGKQRLLAYNTVTFEAKGDDGQVLSSIQRDVWTPSLHFEKRAAKDVPLVYVFPRFLPSLERLAVLIDYTAWVRKVGYTEDSPTAEIRVWPKEGESGESVLQGHLNEFTDSRGTWRHSTATLPEGDYVVRVTVRAPNGQELLVHDDWFEKRIFDWMKEPRGVGGPVPAPFTPLEVSGPSVRPWGRDICFALTGLPESIVSQDKPLLSGPVTLVAVVEGRAAVPKVKKRFAIVSATPGDVRGRADVRLGSVAAAVESTTEYDGFTLFRVTYGPAGRRPVTVNRLRLRVPLSAAFCRFYSASGDREGTSIQGEIVPREQGKFFDSKANTYSVCGSPTFASLFWIGDYSTYFCYAADNDEGWALRDDAPAVEVHREDAAVVLWLNLVDREIVLTEARTLEFSFQTGPVRPLPKGWRGVQFDGDPKAAPVTLREIGGGGFTLHGGPNVLHPGLTPEIREKSRERIQAQSEDGRFTVLGYHRWPAAVKGHPATRVFRGEWGIDRFAWEAAKPRGYQWQKRLHGTEPDINTMLLVNAVPSYVDYITYAYDESLKETNLQGFYDDTGYPISIYDEELALGYVREDGRKVASSGLWIYRERLKRAASVSFLRDRPNYLCDSQHVQAHYQPAYGFFGIWAPCERGYYNHFPDGDNLDFYTSLERYYAYNPSHAFGQIGCAIGMSTPHGAFDLQARDTRCMMMLALLHDQDVGTFGQRDMRTVTRLREARNVFRQWEDDVSFSGFWDESTPVRADSNDVHISLYRRPGSALLTIANTGDEAITSRVIPEWQQLKIDPAAVRCADPETGGEIRCDRSGFVVSVGRHDLKLVLVGDLNGYAYKPVFPGRDLPQPGTLLPELCDSLQKGVPGGNWITDLHEGNSGTGIVDGVFYVQASHYGYGHIRRKLGVDNVSIQCMIMGRMTGQSDDYCAGLGLWWENGSYVRLIPGYRSGKFRYEASGMRATFGREMNTEARPRWYPFSANWIKITLLPEAIRFSVSTDGKTWAQDHEIKRGPTLAGAPTWVILGNGGAGGDQPFFKNPIQKHFVPSRGDRIMLFADFIVGRE